MSRTAIDDAVARRASEGDERALSEIFREFHQPLFRYCLAILGDRQDAEDALQETMIKVLRALPGEQRQIALKPWLYRIAHNESIELLRRRRASVSLEEGELPASEGLAEQVETRQRLRQLIVDVGTLPERQRGVLLMREAGGLGFEEIAAALETSPGVARQTLYEARLGLREMNSGRDMDCAAVTRALSDGDGRVRRRRDIRAHLRDCADCRRFAEEIDSRRNDLAAIAPLPAAAVTALLHGILGGGAGAATATAGAVGAGAGSAGGGAVAGTAVKSAGLATLLKGAAATALVAAIGVGAADRGGLIHVGASDSAPAKHSGSGDGGRTASEKAALPAAPSAVRPPSSRSVQSGSPGSIAPGRAESPLRGEPAANGAAPAASEPPVAEGEAGPASTGSSGAEHPHGRGHVKQTPPSATHGQEEAASKKPKKSPGSSAPKPPSSHGSKPAASPQPPHPTHPSHPAHPVTPEGPAAPEPPGRSESKNSE